tara:strand:+ start:1363 stop:1605 length:243 start_codon:yes stop_codon:yes gene_type:complete
MKSNEYEQTKAWLKANQASDDNSRHSLFNDHRHAIVASSDPYGLLAEVISEGKEYHYCNGSYISYMMKKGMKFLGGEPIS